MTDDAARRGWMDRHLSWFADYFGVLIVGQSVHTDRFHSVGAKVELDGGPAWLRVVYADPEWGVGEYLDGNVTAGELDLPRPHVLRWLEREDEGRRLRAELQTYIAARPIAPGMILTSEPELPEPWFDRLREILDQLAAHPSPRSGLDPDDLDHGIRAFFGVGISTRSVPWTSAHCDLHWNNLTAPELFLLDWEIWGKAPAGYDAATLYCASLLTPDANSNIQHTLGRHLQTTAGRIATLAAAVRFLRFVDEGQYSPLAAPLHAAAHSALINLSPINGLS
ncbi:hypothetical protein [Kribbella solani]|uniref:Aminoglycoside phosphotransferase domain-containing protein n=1 Tax=Kribbella solani TaxID=236067 RepID=A0A841DWM2_9ACTN|nr:hypothetical protein [Kribbella solani]MBB5980647.1 hypothetical protein [Kribbella solani]